MLEPLNDFLKQLQLRYTPATCTGKKSRVRGFVHYLNKQQRDYREAKKEDVEKYLLEKNIQAQSMQEICHDIRTFYEHLKIEPNPAQEVRFHIPWKKRQRLFKVPSADEVLMLIQKTANGTCPLAKRNALALELAYGSGLRRTELTRLNVDDIDLVEKTAHVWGKGNKDRIVPITESAVHAFREYFFIASVVRGPLLRSRMGSRLTCTGISQMFQKNIGIRPHLFRHACALHMLQNGCNIRYIQKLLGHERLDSTQIYTQIDKKNLQGVVERTHPRAGVK